MTRVTESIFAMSFRYDSVLPQAYLTLIWVPYSAIHSP